MNSSKKKHNGRGSTICQICKKNTFYDVETSIDSVLDCQMICETEVTISISRRIYTRYWRKDVDPQETRRHGRIRKVQCPMFRHDETCTDDEQQGIAYPNREWGDFL